MILREMIDDMMMMNDFCCSFFSFDTTCEWMQHNTNNFTLFIYISMWFDFFYTITDFCILYDVLFCSSCVPFDKYK